MPTYKYKKGENIVYNSEYYTIFRHRDVSGSPGYLLRHIDNGTVIDNVLETDCSDSNNVDIINGEWANFTYDGDNQKACTWIIDNILKKTYQLETVEFGHNTANTVYTFKCTDGTWTKNKS